jgi:hypothetical protein
MTKRIRGAWPLLLLALSVHSDAQEDTAQIGEALSMISRFAGEMCTGVDSASSSSSFEVSGEAKAKLDTLISKIVDLGIGASAKYTQAQAKGVLQKDLAQAFKDANSCRLQVLETLKDRLLPAGGSASNADAQKLAGLWFAADDRSTSHSVTIRGRRFHSIEFGKNGRTVASIDGVVSNGVVEGSWYLEPAGAVVDGKQLLSERKLGGRVVLRLDMGDRRLIGTLTTAGSKPMTVVVHWMR